MNLILKRDLFRDDGIFGQLLDDRNERICYTLEHAYDAKQGNGSYSPKMLPGVYECNRGLHHIGHNLTPITTFEIEEGPEHDNILFHYGNYNKDSEGCVLLGEAIIHSGKEMMLTNSKLIFARFMHFQKDVDKFTLVVTNL